MTVYLLIRGKVQGVFFRSSAKEQAEILGVTGWVKNTPTGHVELMASGNDAAVGRLIDWCRQGPPRAVVSQVEVREVDEIRFNDFALLK
jgi:acylphosphatase